MLKLMHGECDDRTARGDWMMMVIKVLENSRRDNEIMGPAENFVWGERNNIRGRHFRQGLR